MSTTGRNYFDILKDCKSFCTDREREGDCFKIYDQNADGFLDSTEFCKLCEDLFVRDGDRFHVSSSESDVIFDQFDENKDGKIDKEEFHILWRYWLPLVLTPRQALIVVDVQNDFIDGSLAVDNAAEIVPVINRVLDEVVFEQVVYTFDWHPEDHVSFHCNIAMRELHQSSPIKKEHANMFDTVVFSGPVPTEQTLWPAHCVQHSHGAKLHQDLKIAPNHVKIYKGLCNHIDSYSAFFDNKRLSQTDLASRLCALRITDVFVCGLALDVCVRHTAIDASHLGFRSFVVEDMCRAITEVGGRKALKEMEDAGCMVVSSSEVNSLAEGNTRHPQMGLKAAVNVAEARRKAKLDQPKLNGGHASVPEITVNGAEEGLLLDL